MPKTVTDEIAKIKDEDTRFMAQQFYSWAKGKLFLDSLGEPSWNFVMKAIANYENYGAGEVSHASAISYWKMYLEEELGK